MSEVTVASMVVAIMDINDLLGLEPAIETADKNAVQLAALVEKRQKGDEKFLATDFIPGKQNSLKIATVQALKGMKVTLPKTWADRLADAIEDGTEDYVPKAPVAAPKAKADVKAAPVAVPKAKTTSAIKAEIKAKADAKVASAKAEIKAKAAPKAKAPKAKAPKAAATEGEATEAGDKRPMNERSARMTELVSKGIEKEEFFKIIHEEFGTTMKTLHMTLAHFKNPKWNRLDKLIVEKDGILTFQE